MLEQLIVLPLLFIWVLFITTIAPMVLANKKFLLARPNLGLTLWFLVFLSAVAATGFGIVLALWSMFRTYQQLSSAELFGETWFLELLLSMVPWAFLALIGVVLAWINIKLDPLFESARDIHEKLSVVGKSLQDYRGVSVHEFAEIQPLVFSTKLSGNYIIFVSSGARSKLNGEQLDVVFEHEYAHIKNRHYQIKRIAKLIRTLTPRLAASNALVSEVHLLCESSANNYAAGKFGAARVAEVTSVFMAV